MIRVLALALVTLAWTGCAKLAVTTSSIPQQADAAHRRYERSGFLYLVMGSHDGAERQLESTELRLITRLVGAPTQLVAVGPLLPILPVPARWWPEEPPNTFFLEIQLAPERPLSFSPLDSTLRELNGSEIHPVAFLGPMIPERIGTFFSWQSNMPTVFVPAGRRSCFVLQFERKESARQIEDYAETVGARREMLKGVHGTQVGDPHRVGEAVVMLSKLDEPPLHLLLGRDVYTAYREKLTALQASVAEWEAVTLDVNFPDADEE